MSLRHLFVMDPLESLNKELDTSLRLMFELRRLGHEVFYTKPQMMAWDKSAGCAHAHCQRVSFDASPTGAALGASQLCGLQGFSAIHMRKDPPYDMDYITTTWLLETARGQARLYNDPAALRTYNEKLSIFRFSSQVRDGLASSNGEELLEFIENRLAGDAILKPLHLYGGRGVQRLRLGEAGMDRSAALALLDQETQQGNQMRLVQAFDPAIFSGEVRVFTAFGQPVAWCLKKPDGSNYLANTRSGATLHAYQPSDLERRRTAEVAQALLAEGIVFTGLDLIGGYVSEINITSPRLLQAPDDHRNYYRDVAAMVADQLTP